VDGLMDSGRLKRAFCVHGDPEACEALAEGIRQKGLAEVLVPERGQQVEL
jgi:hypothetical protein